MTPAIHSTLVEIDRHIDLLDQSEPGGDPSRWRPSIECLRGALAKARRLRWRLRMIAPFVGAAFSYAADINVWPTNLFVGFFACTFLTAIAIDLALEHLLPILRREDRVQSLLVNFEVPLREALDFAPSVLARLRGIFQL